MKSPLHDWVCDSCGRKVYGRRKVPNRCHAYPMRPMGSPWKYATDKFYAAMDAKARAEGPCCIFSLDDEYWIGEAVLERLQKIVDSDPSINWQSSVRRRGGLITANSYEGLK